VTFRISTKTGGAFKTGVPYGHPLGTSDTPNNTHMKRTQLLITCLALGSLGFAKAGTVVADTSKVSDNAVAPAEQSIFDKIWSLAQIYKDDTNPIIEEFDFTGRMQLDYFHNDYSSRGKNDFLEIRRFRLGEDAFFAERHIEIKADLDTALDAYHKERIFYNRMTNLFVNFHVDDQFNVKVGKQEPHFGYGRMESDTLQPFFERTWFDDQIFNNPGNDYNSAVTIFGKIGNFGYLASVISLNVDQEFGDFNGGQAYLAEINYDFKDVLHADRALWVLDYLHTNGLNANSNVFNALHNAVDTYMDYHKGPFGLVTELGYEDGTNTKGDVYMASIMPSYDITDKLQVEVRYTYMHGSDPNSITDLNRQTSTLGKFTGDRYNEGYLGLNYFIYGKKLRLMAGIQYNDLSGGTGAKAGESGWTSLVGIRMYW
jgi:phosphate-selective porin OprO and OprP